MDIEQVEVPGRGMVLTGLNGQDWMAMMSRVSRWYRAQDFSVTDVSQMELLLTFDDPGKEIRVRGDIDLISSMLRSTALKGYIRLELRVTVGEPVLVEVAEEVVVGPPGVDRHLRAVAV